MPGRPWTRKQEEILVSMRQRNPPSTLKECAKVLNRTVNAISRKLHDLKVVIQPHQPFSLTKREIEEILHKPGASSKHDGYISCKLKRSRKTIRWYRKRLGKKAHKPPGWAQGNDKRRRFSGRVRCLNCNILCPILARSNNWKELTGWVSRRIIGGNEIYCGLCFEAYGWCDNERRKICTPVEAVGNQISTEDVQEGGMHNGDYGGSSSHNLCNPT